MAQESLLAGTDAIRKGETTITTYRGKHLVRSRSLPDGYATQRKFEWEDRDEAMKFFWELAYKRQAEARKLL